MQALSSLFSPLYLARECFCESGETDHFPSVESSKMRRRFHGWAPLLTLTTSRLISLQLLPNLWASLCSSSNAKACHYFPFAQRAHFSDFEPSWTPCRSSAHHGAIEIVWWGVCRRHCCFLPWSLWSSLSRARHRRAPSLHLFHSRPLTHGLSTGCICQRKKSNAL